MTTEMLIEEVRAFGAALCAEGERLRVVSDHPLPDELLRRLKVAKPALIAALRHSAVWDKEDWRAQFDEYAGVAQYDNRVTRAKAERIAFEGCIALWLSKNPPQPGAAFTCINCGLPTSCVNAVALAIPRFTQGAWVHSHCLDAYRRARRAEATSVLAVFGVTGAASCD
jgi:hypothetical protein